MKHARRQAHESGRSGRTTDVGTFQLGEAIIDGIVVSDVVRKASSSGIGRTETRILVELWDRRQKASYVEPTYVNVIGFNDGARNALEKTPKQQAIVVAGPLRLTFFHDPTTGRPLRRFEIVAEHVRQRHRLPSLDFLIREYAAEWTRTNGDAGKPPA